MCRPTQDSDTFRSVAASRTLNRDDRLASTPLLGGDDPLKDIGSARTTVFVIFVRELAPGTNNLRGKTRQQKIRR